MKAALFDLDGVVIDTEPQYTTFWQEIGRKRFPNVPDFAQQVKGCTLKEITNRWFGGSDEEKRNIQTLLDTYELQMHYPYIPGVCDFLQRLRTEGIKTALVTSSNHKKMDCVATKLPELASRFDRIFTAEDTPASKPAPDCYVIAAKTLGAEPADCVVFEDSLNGLKAGRGSGACVVGLTTSLPADTIRPLCDAIIPDFTASDVLEQLFRK